MIPILAGFVMAAILLFVAMGSELRTILILIALTAGLIALAG